MVSLFQRRPAHLGPVGQGAEGAVDSFRPTAVDRYKLYYNDYKVSAETIGDIGRPDP